MIDIPSKHDDMRKNGIFYALISINNRIISCVNFMLSCINFIEKFINSSFSIVLK